MADWPLSDGQRYKTYLNAAGTAAAGATQTAAVSVLAGTGVKGSWVTAVTSLEFNASGVYININYTPLRVTMDIGVGSTPTVVIPDLVVEAPATASAARQVFVPIAFPAGSLISVRTQSDAARETRMSLMFVGSGFDAESSMGLVTAYGAASGLGTIIDPGAVVDTKGAVTSLLSATTVPTRYLIVSIGTASRTQNPSAVWLVDITVDGVVAIPDIPIRTATASDTTGQAYFGPYALQLPVGVTLGARAQCSTASTNPGRTLTVSLLGIS